MEKNGSVVLTKEDIDLYNAGIVSDRLRDNWNLDLTALRAIVNSNNYNTVSTQNEESGKPQSTC